MFRETESIGLIGYKEFAVTIVEAGESQIFSVGWQTGDPVELIVQFQSEGSLLESCPLLEEADLLFYLGLQPIG